MLLAQEPNLREVIAFPMTQNAEDLLMNAPSPVSEKQLRELHIRIVEPRKDGGAWGLGAANRRVRLSRTPRGSR